MPKKKYKYKYATHNLSGNTATLLVQKSRVPQRIGNKSSNFSYTSPEEIERLQEYREEKVISISLCNTFTDAVIVDLYAYYTSINQTNDPSIGQRNEDNTLDVIDDTYETYYLLKNVYIYPGSTLTLDIENELCYNDIEADLYIQLGHSTSTVDAIIKTL